MKIRSYFIGSIIPAAIGLVLGELLMTRMFELFQPALAGMTFLTVEVMGAFLIDFPLAGLSAFLITNKQPRATARDGVLAGAAFITTFLAFILLMIVIRQFTSAIDTFGLYKTISVAVQSARDAFGSVFPLTILAFLAFDFLLGMTAGLIGFELAGRARAV